MGSRRRAVWLIAAGSAGALTLLVWLGATRRLDLPLLQRTPRKSDPSAPAHLATPQVDPWVGDIQAALASGAAPDDLLARLRTDRARATGALLLTWGAVPAAQRPALIRLVGRLGGEAAYALLVDLAGRPAAGTPERAEILAALPQTARRPLLQQLARWYTRPTFEPLRDRIADLMVAAGSASAATEVEAALPSFATADQAALRELLGRIRAKLDARSRLETLRRTADPAVLVAALAPERPVSERLLALRRLEQRGDTEAVRTIGASVTDLAAAPSTYQLNALAALIRLGERQPDAIRQSLQIVQSARGQTATAALGRLLTRYAGTYLTGELRALLQRPSCPDPTRSWLLPVVERLDARRRPGSG